MIKCKKFPELADWLRNYGWIPEWPKGTDCKSAGTAFEGSNPSPPILHNTGLQAVKCNLGCTKFGLCIKIYQRAGVAELADAQDLKSCCSDTVPVRFRSPALRGLKCWSSFSIWGFLFLCWDKKNPPAHRCCGRRIFFCDLIVFWPEPDILRLIHARSV